MRDARCVATSVFPSTKYACGLVVALRLALVFHVLLFCYIAQIIKSVVISLPVYVINLTLRPRSGHIQPSKSMAFIIFLINRSHQIAFVGKTSGHAPLFDACLFDAPREHSRRWVVVKHFFEPSLRKHLGSLTHPERA